MDNVTWEKWDKINRLYRGLPDKMRYHPHCPRPPEEPREPSATISKWDTIGGEREDETLSFLIDAVLTDAGFTDPSGDYWSKMTLEQLRTKLDKVRVVATSTDSSYSEDRYPRFTLDKETLIPNPAYAAQMEAHHQHMVKYHQDLDTYHARLEKFSAEQNEIQEALERVKFEKMTEEYERLKKKFGG